MFRVADLWAVLLLQATEQRSLWNAAKKAVGWEGVGFLAFFGLATLLLQMKKLWFARVAFVCTAVALALKLAMASDEHLPQPWIIHGKYIGVFTALLFLSLMLYWVSRESAKLKPKTATQLPVTSRGELTPELMKQIEEEYGYELKKLQPNFVDFANDDGVAHNDQKGVIISGSPLDQETETFRAFARSFGNEHPRDKVKSVKKTSFRLQFVCYDRETRNKPQNITIHRGAWMNEEATEIDFPAHCPPRRAVIVTVEGDDNSIHAVRRDSDSTYKGIHPLREKLTGGVYLVSLTLLVESKNSKPFQYVLEITREPVVDLQMNDAAFWKRHHLHNFIDESFGFSKTLHEIWKDAHNQAPLPPVADQPATIFPNILTAALNQEKPSPPIMDVFEVIRRREAIQRAGEETLIDPLADWQSRVAAFVELWLGKEQSDKFVNCEPTFEDGLNCKPRRSRLYKIFSRPGTESAATEEPENWSLSDAVSRRRDVLMELVRSLK